MEEYIEHGREHRQGLGPAGIVHGLVRIPADTRALWRARHVIHSLVAADLKVRYQRSALGFLWTLVNPILMLSVLAIIFSQIVRIEMSNFALYVFSGLLPWQFFTAVVLDGGRSLLVNEALIKKVRLNKLALPVARMLIAAINWLLATVALFLALLLLGASAGPALLALPFAMLLWLVFALGLTLISMTLVTYFRDCDHFLDVFLQAWYFASPILYPIALLGPNATWLMWNPVTHFMTLFHLIIYESAWPGALDWALPAALALASLLGGYVIYKRLEHDYVFRL